jgi:hypothetical protein
VLCAQTLYVRLGAIKELDLFLDLIKGRRIWQGACRSSCPLRSWLCGFVHRIKKNVRGLKTNKEEEKKIGGHSPTLG